MAIPNVTLNHIAQILSFNTDVQPLETTLKNYSETDWEALVKVASSHLVLTTVYCRLQQKGLLYILPEDLKIYLEELTTINRNRNKAILKQVTHLSLLLHQHHINHVFLKGVALAVSGYYRDLGERMIGDIDILVDQSQLKKTSLLLLNTNYKYNSTTFGAKYFKSHHDIQLIPKKEGIAAVEIHKDVLHTKARQYLITKNLLQFKCIINNISVPSGHHLIEHTILNHELNDYGFIYNDLGFRNAYDYLILNTDNNSKHYNHKYTNIFISKVNYYFKEVIAQKLGHGLQIKFIFFKLRKKNKSLNKLFFYITNTKRHLGTILERTSIFITNKNYRNEAWQDRKRLIKLIKAKFLK